MTFEAKVRPGGKQDRLFMSGDTLVLELKAKAVEGAANDAAARLLAKTFKIRRQDVLLKKGKTARFKVFEISGLSGDECAAALANVPRRTND